MDARGARRNRAAVRNRAAATLRGMRTGPKLDRVAAAAALTLAAACSRSDEPAAARRERPAPPEGTLYAGELVLRGDPESLHSGSATVAVLAPGSDVPLLARSWDLGDPAWRIGRDGARLYFALDGRDEWPGATGAFGGEMELSARYDPDGNPATDEPGTARARLAVRSGARDLVVELAVERRIAGVAGPGGG